MKAGGHIKDLLNKSTFLGIVNKLISTLKSEANDRYGLDRCMGVLSQKRFMAILCESAFRTMVAAKLTELQEKQRKNQYVAY